MIFAEVRPSTQLMSRPFIKKHGADFGTFFQHIFQGGKL